MKIQEINSHGELKIDWDLLKRFESKGWMIYGEGRDQVALGKPNSDMILKIVGFGSLPRKATIRKYVTFFRSNQKNPHFPRVGPDKELIWNNKRYYAYSQEKLYPLAGDDKILDYLEDTMHRLSNDESPDYDNVPPGLSVEQIEGLVMAIESMFRAGLGNPFGFDLSNVYNIMQRKNGQLVIVDPYSSLDDENIDESLLKEYSLISPSIRKHLEKKGYKFLGSGVDQEAYLEPGTGHVLKVFGTQCTGKLSKDQRMFKTYAAYCAKNQQNPYLPRIYGYETFEVPTRRVTIHSEIVENNCVYLQIRMERLTQFNQKMRKFFEDMSRSVRADDTWDDFYAQKQYERDSILHWERIADNSDSMKLIYNLYSTMQDLYDIARENNFNWDLHGNNIMSRTDGTPVITDPWTVGTGK